MKIVKRNRKSMSESLVQQIKKRITSQRVYSVKLTSKDKKGLIVKKYYGTKYHWANYPDIWVYINPAGNLAPTGSCANCGSHSNHLMASYYGNDIIPCCHRCWSHIDSD
jgi:hypothetical protein